jgi:tetratricopeptide (TPR) repeat protein
MKRLILLAPIGCLLTSLGAYDILYAEQYYRMAHRHLYMSPERAAENIYYLEKALRADFANPLNALARIRNPQEWERYRYLFKMHVSLRIIENYLIMANAFDKQVAYFYNSPWKRENLNSLEKAEAWYRAALFYWEEALKWSEKAASTPPLHLEEIRFWIDQLHRITTGELNYFNIIQRHLNRLEKVRADFEAMDASTY